MQKKLSIVQVIDMLNPGGAERVLVTMANLFHANGHQVKVITTVKPGPLAAQLLSGIAFQDLQRKWKWNPVTMYRLIKALKNSDIVHVHSRHNLRYVLLAAAIFGLRKKIFYHEHHGHRIKTKATGLDKKLFSRVIFIAVSEQLRNWAILEACVDAAKAFTLPNIVVKKDTHALKIKSGNIQLLMVANFVPVKNIEFAILVLAELVKKGKKHFHLTIAGAKPDVAYFSSIEQLISEKHLQHLVSFIHDCTDVQPMLPRFDLALHTSTSESGPLVLIEYMAQGLPFITYNTGEVAQQIANELPGSIMHVFDINSWQEGVELLLEKDQNALRLQLQYLFGKYYSAESYYEKCILIYSAGLKL